MGARYSMVYGDTFKFEFWLVFGRDGSMRLSRGQPGSLNRGERAMSCVANLPASLFKTPELKAEITIPKTDAPAEFRIDVEAAGAALRQVVGADIDLRVNGPEEQP
jgi:hypothetical protein